MSLNLYPHNQQAYNNAVEAFETTNRTCIIHPTGTGKSLIIANFIENNPDKKHLLIAPGKHIFDEIRKHTSLEFRTCTYQNLIFNSAESLDLLNCDYIFLDEFHRIGAIEWGEHLNILLQLNPHAFILGTTATHIRYLDDNRDMAEEIFNNNIASAITLQEAIQSKVLKAPKYISALYNVKEVTKDLHDKVLKSDHLDKLIIADDLDKRMIDWQNSNGIDQILAKHLGNDRNKILVFCRTKAHIDQIEEVIMNGIRKVMPDAISLHIYSKYSNTVNEEALSTFALQDEIPKVLFTVAMVNEGLHVKGNNTVILIRDTTSPIIYYQQIGRAFSVNQKQKPLIFDLVNNFDSITGSINQTETEYITDGIERTNSNKISLLSELVEVEFIDEVKDLAQLFNLVYESIDIWEINFYKVKLYFKINGNIELPHSALYAWLKYNRVRRNKNLLTKERIDKLDSLGMYWGKPYNIWDTMFEEAKLLYITNGSLITKKGSVLYRWISVNRANGNNNKLDKDQIDKLESIGIIWNPEESQWNQRFDEAKIFYQTNGHVRFKSGTQLCTWGYTNRANYANNKLSKERSDKLESIGLFNWTPAYLTWDQNFEIARIFYQSNGHLNPKAGPLNIWLNINRMFNNKHSLHLDKVNKLNSIGMQWNIVKDKWYNNYEKAKCFYESNGHFNIKYGAELYTWMITNRENKAKGILTQDRIDKLDSIGIDWTPFRTQWNKRFEEARIIFLNGHLNPISGNALYDWILNQRKKIRNNKLSIEEIQKLKSIGIE